MSVIGFGTLTETAPPNGTIGGNVTLCDDTNYNSCVHTRELNGTISSRSEKLGDCKNRGIADGPASWDSTINSLNVPIGTWLKVFKSQGKDKRDCENTSTEVQRMYWGGGDSDFEQLGQRVPDNVATGCGSSLGISRGEKHIDGFNQRGGSDILSNFCRIGVSATSPEFKDNAGRYQGGIHYPTFCQLNDYIKENQKCQDLISNVSLRGDQNRQTWAHFAMDRYCGKQGLVDPNITDANVFSRRFSGKGNTITKFANQNMIQTEDCKLYCGGATTSRGNNCQENKRNMCSNPNQWASSPDKVQAYCRNFWIKNFNIDDVNQACGDIIVQSNDQNVFAGNGCGFLCSGGTPVNEKYCNDKKIQFCLQPQVDQDGNPSYKNMFTNDCFGFCVQEPERCISNSVDVDGTTDLTGLGEFCTNKYDEFKQKFIEELIIPKYSSDPDNITPEEQELIDEEITNFETIYADSIQNFLKEKVGTSGKILSDFCGCLLPGTVYRGYVENTKQKYFDAGVSINFTAQNIKPECFYPKCKDNSIPSNKANAEDPDCTQCVSNIFQNFSDSALTNVCTVNIQDNCGGGVFSLDEDKAECDDDGGTIDETIDDILEEVPDELKPVVRAFIIIGIIVLFVVVVIVIVKFTNGKGVSKYSMFSMLSEDKHKPLLSSDLLRELQEGYNATFAD